MTNGQKISLVWRMLLKAFRWWLGLRIMYVGLLLMKDMTNPMAQAFVNFCLVAGEQLEKDTTFMELQCKRGN